MPSMFKTQEPLVTIAAAATKSTSIDRSGHVLPLGVGLEYPDGASRKKVFLGNYWKVILALCLVGLSPEPHNLERIAPPVVENTLEETLTKFRRARMAFEKSIFGAFRNMQQNYQNEDY